jgi:MFS superfamily sulfate permease-like transporter
VRSAANVRAGAKTRLSAVLHGVWLLLLVVAAPGLLHLIPTPSLAGLLVVVGVRLVNVRQLRAMWHEGAATIAVYATTLGVILAANLLSGVVAGTALYLALRAVARSRKEAVLF